MATKKEQLDELSIAQRTRMASLTPSEKEKDFRKMTPTLALLTAKKHIDSKKTQESQLDEVSPAQAAKIAKLKEIGQKMKDVNNIFVTGKKMNDDMLMTAARAKLAQLAKIKHDVETQVVDEDTVSGSAGTYTAVFSSPQTPYTWTKFWARDEDDAKERIKEIFKRHGFTDYTLTSLSKDAVEEAKLDPAVQKRLSDRKAEAKQLKKLIKKYPDTKGIYQGIAKLKGLQLDEGRQQDVVNELIAELGDKYDENKIENMVSYLIAGGHTMPKSNPYYPLCKAACDKMGFVCGESVEEAVEIGGIKAKPVAGPGATAGEELDEAYPNPQVIHRVGVVIIDPKATMVTKRDEEIEKFIRVKGGDWQFAMARAKDHYKKKGYRVVDAWYVGEVKDDDEIDEGWKSKLAGAALAGSMALGGAGAAHAEPDQPASGVKAPTTSKFSVSGYNSPEYDQKNYPIYQKMLQDFMTSHPGVDASFARDIVDGRWKAQYHTQVPQKSFTNTPALDEGHAGERDAREAGAADAYYNRKRSPNKAVGGKTIPVTDPEEVAEYNAGYNGNDEKKDFAGPKYRGPKTPRGVDEDLNEIKSGEIKNHPWVGREVKTPDGIGKVTRVEREPTFSQMVPWKTEVWVRLADGKFKTYRKDLVRPVKAKAPVEEAGPKVKRPDFFRVDVLYNSRKIARDGIVKVMGSPYSIEEQGDSAGSTQWSFAVCNDKKFKTADQFNDALRKAMGSAENDEGEGFRSGGEWQHWLKVTNYEFPDEEPIPPKEYYQMNEANDGVDTIEMDVELFIRCLEWAKESAPDDIALHKFTENVVAKNGILTMDDYESLVPQGAPVEEGIGDIVKGIKRAVKGKASPEDVQRKYFDKSMAAFDSGDKKQRAKAAKNYMRVAKVANPDAVKEGRLGHTWGQAETEKQAIAKRRKEDQKEQDRLAAKRDREEGETYNFGNAKVTKPGTIKEDASAGATGSASVATVVSGTPGIIKRTGSSKKKGRYGNSLTPKTFSALSKGIYEAEEKKAEKFDYEAWKKSGSKAKKPRGQWSEKTLTMKGKNKVNEIAMEPASKFVTMPHRVWSIKSPEDQARLKAKYPNLKIVDIPKEPKVKIPKVTKPKVKKEPKPRIPRFKSSAAKTPLEQKAKDAMYDVWQQIASDILDSYSGAEDDYQNPYYVAEACYDADRLMIFAGLTKEEQDEVLKLPRKTLARLASDFGI